MALLVRALTPGSALRDGVVVIALIAVAHAMSVAMVDFALYRGELLSGGPAQIAVPVLERITTILLLAWVLAVARAVPRATGARPGG